MSVLFCDLVGFTTLSQTRDAEDVREMLSEYFAAARTIIARYGGTVEKFIGDAVMAVWGVPSAHEDDAERAVRAGLSLTEAVSLLGERVGASGLSARVGITTDEVAVTVGAVGEGMVAGDPVNTAARIQALARPGSIWCDRSTAELVVGVVATRSTGRHSLKGRVGDVDLYMIEALPAGAVETDRRSLDVPLVGRRRDMAVLRELLHAVEEQRTPRIAVVNGPAGVGKSRLMREIEEYVEGLPSDVLWHRSRCLSYGDGIAFSALSAAVRVRIGATGTDTPEKIHDRLRASLHEIVDDAGERQWIQTHLLRLLGVGRRAEVEETDLDDAFSAWARWFELLAAQGPHGSTPVVWIIDDAHHADAGLVNFVDHLVGTASFAGLVVMLGRPELLERHPRLATHRRTTVVNLQLLTDDELGQLLSHVVDDLPHEVRDALVHRAEGNPLFAVETVRAMHDLGLLESTGAEFPRSPLRVADDTDLSSIDRMAAPTSLQVLIASRLDLLGADQRRLVTAGAVLGQVFTLAGLRALTGFSEHQTHALVADLVARDVFTWIRDRLSADGGRIGFLQPSVRDVAYAQQSRRDRIALHLAAVDHLQRQSEANSELAAVIAQHLRDARGLLPADDTLQETLTAQLLSWLTAAMERAAEVGGFDEVLTLGREIVALGADAPRETSTRLVMGEAAMALSQLDDVVTLLGPVATDAPDANDRARAAALAARAHALRGDAARRWRALEPFVDPAVVASLRPGPAATIAGRIMVWFEDNAEWTDALIWQERMLTSAERSGQPAVLASALFAVAQSESLRGHRVVGRELRRLAVDYSRENHLTAQLCYSLVVAQAFELEEDLAAAVEIGKETIAVATTAGDRSALEQAVANQALALCTLRRWDDLDALAEAHPVIDDWIAEITIRVQRALAAYARGDGEAAMALLDVPLRDDAEGIHRMWFLAPSAVRHWVRGERDAALEVAAHLVETAYHHCRLVDEYAHHLGMVGPWFIEAGQSERLREIARPALDAEPFERSPLLNDVLARLFDADHRGV
ncbi:adenylate/guanylate cyclase domain-containing protein [Microbacterium testaceum]|uniref:adenylate/guanylate cyclase domain-containing protein n=1 Tax=Microbacterium testaceum TaxID=2033 RepID=UPI001FA78E03|nr:adenylate/guanylate cyclase domain-containing protein [Microbacterium testaceum]